MKKLFCVVTVVCLLTSLVCVSALAGTKEHDEQILSAAPTATETATEPTATETEPRDLLVGDANGDGAINMKDVLTVRKYLAELTVVINLTRADMTRDGEINMKDVLALRLRIAYEKDAGLDEVEFTVVGELELSGNKAAWDLPRISVVRNRTELEMLAALNDEQIHKQTDLSAFTDDYFKEHALLLIYHVSGCAPTGIAAFERLSDTSIYLRYTVPGYTQPWMVFAMQMVEFSAEDAANLKTIVTPDESTTGISSDSEKTVTFPAVAPVKPTEFWSDFCA